MPLLDKVQKVIPQNVLLHVLGLSKQWKCHHNTLKAASDSHFSLFSCGERITLSWHGFSQGNICLRLLPSALSTSRMERTSSASSGGSSDAAWSLPFNVLSKVTWRSMIFAPRDTAATEILIPDSWPEYPMGISGNSFWYSCNWQVGETSVTLKGKVLGNWLIWFLAES